MTVNEMIQKLNEIKELGGGEFTVHVYTGINDNAELDCRNVEIITANFAVAGLNSSDKVTIWSTNKED